MDDLISLDSTQLAAACEDDLALARQALERCKALPADAGFDAVLAAYDAIDHPLNRSAGLAHLFFQVHPQAELRERMAQVEQDISRFSNELSLDRGLYDRLAQLDPDSTPDPVARRIVEHALRDFRRAGVDRDTDARSRITRLRERLVELSQEFSRNIASDVRAITLDGAADLDGLPQDYVDGHPPGEDGRIRISTDPPDLLPFMKFARVREHRRALHRASQCRGAPDNFGVLDEIIAARHELAGLLGYSSWAAYITEDKMIRSDTEAARFIERVVALTDERSRIETGELLEALRPHDRRVEQLRDYDRMYAVELVRNERFAFDTRDVRPYLPYDAVRQGVLDTVSRLYGVTVQRRQDAPVWHPDVEAYELREGEQVIARFYLDMHPREDKFKHAAMFNLESGLLGQVLPSACLVCNMPKPGGNDPALLDPGDVRTFFHEFGHLLHHLLAGRQRWLAVSGISTEWDFVEVPSQLFEEWCRDEGVLAGFARHHQTGEPIPGELVRRMNRATEYGKGLNTRLQMFYAALSLEYFSRDPQNLDTTAVLKELKARYVPFPHEEGTSLQTSFGHLDGYSALYYTYMWSLVLAKDCLSAFNAGLMDVDTARRFRSAVLEPGGSRDAAELVQDFLGRPFSFDAFESWLAA